MSTTKTYRPSATRPSCTGPQAAASPGIPAPVSTLRRHLRCALVGTLLAIVAIAGLSAYSAQGVGDALQAALNRAHLAVSAPR